VSKWETEAAIPELDKLIKMCDIFGVTLDELTGREVKYIEMKNESQADEKESALSTSKIVGYILLASTIIASILVIVFGKNEDIFYITIPILFSILICSIICLCLKKHIGYWCLWAALAPISVLSAFVVASPVFINEYTQIAVYIFMTILAKKVFNMYTVQTSKKRTVQIVSGLVVCVSIWILCRLLSISHAWASSFILNSILYTVLALLLPYSVIYFKSKKRNNDKKPS
jgi:transcriptional regulator with XRE-family HTH domain